MKWLDGWKVVKVRGGRFFSCFAGVDLGHNGGKQTAYPKRGVAVAPARCGPLAVFKTRAAARWFLWKDGGWTGDRRIIKCRYVPSKKRRLYTARYDWGGRPLARCPHGTAFATRARLCRENQT